MSHVFKLYTVKPVLSSHSKRPKPGFIKLPFVFQTFVLTIFESPLKTGCTEYSLFLTYMSHRLKLS